MHSDAQVMHRCYNGPMKAITLRNIPPRVAQAIRKKAAAEKTSLNKAVIGLLEVSTGHGKPEKKRDLSRWVGSWTKEEADTFDRNLAEQRKIDWEMWR